MKELHYLWYVLLVVIVVALVLAGWMYLTTTAAFAAMTNKGAIDVHAYVGSEVEANITVIGQSFHDLGDINWDGKIDLSDLVMLAKYYNSPASSCPDCDLNHDGMIGLGDLVILSNNYNKAVAPSYITPFQTYVKAGKLKLVATYQTQSQTQLYTIVAGTTQTISFYFIRNCDSQCKSQGYSSGTCRTNNTNTNLAVIPDDWGNYDHNPSSWIGYGSGNQIVFLDTTVERTPGYPSIWHRYTHIPACSNETYDSSQSACLSHGGTWNPAGDMNGARECDGVWYNVSVGDHIVFKCWEKTGLSQHPAYNNDPTDSYGVGARIGMDLYAPDPNRPGYIMIVAGALVNGVGYDDTSISGHYSSAGSDVPCNTSTWTQQVIDYIVPSGYGITQVVGWMQMRPEQGDSVQGWFADCELYINPTCHYGETSIGQDNCSSNNLCCCA